MSDENVELAAGDDQPQRSDPAVAHTELPGRVLASKRQELNWSAEDVARFLHLAPRQVQAIEADNYGALPGMAITRGFIRSYAKMLKLDPAPLLEKIGTETDSRAADVSLRRPLPAKPFYQNRTLNLGAGSRSWMRGAMAILFLAMVAFLVIAWKADWLSPSWMADAGKMLLLGPSAHEGGRSKGPSADSLEEQNSTTEASPSVGMDVSGPAAISAAGASADLQTSDRSPTQATQPAISENNALGQAAVISGDKDMLVLKLREDSWIEIRNTRNKVLLSRLAKAGESEAIPVSEPVKLVVGNAAGVDAQLRGVPVELNAAAKNNVARLTIN